MKVGILVGFSRVHSANSIFQVVWEQIWMVHEAAHHPVLLAPTDLHWPEAPSWLEIRAVLPPYNKVKYASLKDLSEEHRDVAARAAAAYRSSCRDLDIVFAHGFLDQGGYLPLADGLRQALWELLEKPSAWLHWIHSVLGERRDFWALPPKSRLVSSTEALRGLFAERFDTAIENVVHIPHARDPRSFLLATELARRIVTEHGLLEAELVQTYPIDLNRSMAKGLHQVIAVFAALKTLGRSVRLIVADSGWGGTDHETRIQGYHDYAAHLGLTKSELVFTSVIVCANVASSDGPVGVSTEVVRDLMSVSNVFVYPTKSEAFGLALAEAAMSGQLLVLNADLPVMREIAGAGTALFFPFGAFPERKTGINWGSFYEGVARKIVETADADLVFRAKTLFQRTYNRQVVWRKLACYMESLCQGELNR